MTPDRISVFVNGVKIELYRGLQVKHALLALDYKTYEACLRGDLIVEDEHGFSVDLGGALGEGTRLFTRERKGEVTQ